MLAIASFIAAFPTSHIMSEKPIFGVPVFRSGEQRGVRAWDDVSKSKHSFEFDVEFGIEYPPASLESPHA